MKSIVHSVKLFLRAILPSFLIDWLYNRWMDMKWIFIKWRIIRFLKGEDLLFPEADRKSIINWLQHHKWTMIPYEFTRKYKVTDIDVYTDEDVALKYVIFERKRLYFKRGLSDADIREYYVSLLREQDIESPHRYVDTKCNVAVGDVVADVGAAEGFFALSIIERASKVYLIECEETWIEALCQTFKPYHEKIELVAKFVSDRTDGDQLITFDDLVGGSRVDFIKVDIEGAEMRMLYGAKRTLENNHNLKLAICTYHNERDASEIQNHLVARNFETHFSPHYMIIFSDPNLKTPWLRQGVIRAVKLISHSAI